MKTLAFSYAPCLLLYAETYLDLHDIVVTIEVHLLYVDSGLMNSPSLNQMLFFSNS